MFNRCFNKHFTCLVFAGSNIGNKSLCGAPATFLPSFFFVFCIVVHIYPPYTRKRIVSLYFGRDVHTRLGVAISEVSGPPVFHIKAGASR